MPVGNTNLQHAATKAAISTNIRLYANKDNQRIRIGTVQSFAPNQSRPIVRVREIGNEKIVEIVPGFTDINFSVNRFALYAQNMLQAFGYTSARTLMELHDPFDLEESMTVPVYNAQNKLIGTSNEILTYKGCWLQNFSRQVTISGNLIIVENASVAVTDVTHFKN